jgi:SPP1 gp7 family putative phage head morphogenesis protein
MIIGGANSAMRQALIIILKAQRQKMSVAARQRRAKLARWLYPWAQERHYAASIRNWMRPMREYVRNFLATNSEAILHGDSASAVIRKDATPGKTFKLMVDSLNGWVGKYVPEKPAGAPYGEIFSSPIYVGLSNIAKSTFDFNGKQYEKSAKHSLGIDFPVDESWWKDARSAWINQNYALIQSDLKKYIAQVNSLTEKAVMSGWSVGTLKKEMQTMDGKMKEGRANFIARDQIGKLNGQITQSRMESAGLSMYEWSTSGDERVRTSHRLMDGKLCRWDDATVYSQDGGKTWKPRPSGAVMLHPGADYQCRCCALAYWNEIMDEADAGEVNDKTTALTVPESKPPPPATKIEDNRIKELVGKVANEQEAIELGGLLLDKAVKENRDIFAVMGDYRKFGSIEPHEFVKGSAKINITRITDAQKYYPEDWLLRSIQGAKDDGLKTTKAARGYYSSSRVWDKNRGKYIPVICLDERQFCEVHEMAHRMEHMVPEIIKIEKEFYDRRTKDEKTIRINSLKGYGRYGSKEKTRLDKFADPYMGKDYGGSAYEILSMGVENFKTKTYNTDAEYNAFIVGVLTGVK